MWDSINTPTHVAILRSSSSEKAISHLLKNIDVILKTRPFSMNNFLSSALCSGYRDDVLQILAMNPQEIWDQTVVDVLLHQANFYQITRFLIDDFSKKWLWENQAIAREILQRSLIWANMSYQQFFLQLRSFTKIAWVHNIVIEILKQRIIKEWLSILTHTPKRYLAFVIPYLKKAHSELTSENQKDAIHIMNVLLAYTYKTRPIYKGDNFANLGL